MSPSGIEEASTALGLGAKILGTIRRPFAALAFRLAGLNEENERYRRESRRIGRDHELKVCDELDECVLRVEELGPLIYYGSVMTPGFEKAEAEYRARKHRLRDLDTQLPALCDASARAVSSPEEWQRIAQLARPAIATRRRTALS